MRRTQPGPRTGVYPHVARWSSGAFKQPPSAKSGFSFFLFDGCLGVAQSGRAMVLMDIEELGIASEYLAILTIP
jgi:hypothetical protein